MGEGVSTAPFVKILNGDVLDQLRTIPDESVQCVVTSPPYHWGLRDYSRCGCAVGRSRPELPNSPAGWAERDATLTAAITNDPLCPICHGTGKIAGTERQLGLEPTPEQYIANMTRVFHEVKRVLRKDGTCWVNMGDCYASSWSTSRRSEIGLPAPPLAERVDRCSGSLKEKDLVGQPWRLAFALQVDGWYLRSDIIWAKPNPMPESVTDRPTKAHEYIFLLSKSPRYFYDAEAIREPHGEDFARKGANHTRWKVTKGHDVTDFKQSSMSQKKGGFNEYLTAGEIYVNPAGRNSRTVWEIATQPYPEAHFATFPEELPRRCIKAGTSEKGCCPKCGSPWERIIEKEFVGDNTGLRENPGLSHNCRPPAGAQSHSKSMGWQPTCSCGLTETAPCTVLDPFAGSGTTGAVARSMGRSSILIELNPEYVKLIRERCETSHVALECFEEAELVDSK